MMCKFVKQGRRGFTLVEIMIVVLIIGILLAIAVPNFIKARETSRAKACVANLKEIESAKEQWAMDTKAASTATPGTTDLYGAANYIRNTPGRIPRMGALRMADRASARTVRVSAGSMMPSSHRRAVL